MKTLEQLKAEQAKELAKLEREHALAALCVVPPDRVQITSGNLGHWLSYKVPSLWAALDLMRLHSPLPFYSYKRTFTRLVPEALNIGRDAGEETGGPFVAKLDVSQGEGFGPTVHLAFFVQFGDDICMIRCELEGEHHRNQFPQFGASFQANLRGQSRRNDGARFISGDFRANGSLAAMFDSYVKWGAGDRDSAHFTYSIMCDSVGGDCVDWRDAELRLENVAREMCGERPE